MSPLTNRVKFFVVIPLILLLHTDLIADNSNINDNMSSLWGMTLEELLNIRVSTVSLFEENIQDVPATVVVITQEMIQKRGYKEFSEIYNDLAGVEIIRPFSDTWTTETWRGTQATAPVLLLLDGNVMNHLFYSNTEIQSSFVLSNIKQIEIVSGPAAVTYGDNAFLATINVITYSGAQNSEDSFNGFISGGENERRIVDFHSSINRNDWHINLAFRQDQGFIDDRYHNEYEYTKSKYYSDPLLWGAFVNNDKYAGKYQSPHSNSSIDFRIAYKSTEMALQYFELDTGYGNKYAGDKAQNLGQWIRPDAAFHIRHDMNLSDQLKSTTRFRYRQSDVDNDSFFLEGFPFNNEAQDIPGGRLIDLSYWRSKNRSKALYQDFQWSADNWQSAFGLRYEEKKLQKAYDITRGDYVPPSSLTDLNNYAIPSPPTSSTIANNSTKTDEHSLYGMVTRKLANAGWGEQQLNFGMRYENHSEFGVQSVYKAGYVLQQGNVSYKLMWGQAFQEPSQRLLYGGYIGFGSAEDLQPEESSTVEASWNYFTGNTRLSFIFVEVDTEQSVSGFAGGASNNPGKRKVRSFDLIAQKTMNHQGVNYKPWLNYSHIFNIKAIDRATTIDQSYSQGSSYGPNGNVAEDKIKFGVNMEFSDSLSTNISSRYISKRYTSALNPIDEVPSYFVTDVNFRWTNIVKGLDCNIKVNNFFDELYYHPGVNSGNAGDTPGEFNGDGDWVGSQGFYSSILPQAGREIFLNLNYSF